MSTSSFVSTRTLDVFTKHEATLVSEVEEFISFLAEPCRDAGIITRGLFHELTQFPGTNENKAKKFVGAVSQCIEAQPVDIEPEKCVLKQFVAILKREDSLVGIAGELENSMESFTVEVEETFNVHVEETRSDVLCTDDLGKDPLDEPISEDHLLVIGAYLPNWIKYAKALNLSEANIQGINTDRDLDYEMKGQKVLELWSNQYLSTYRILCDVCVKLKDCRRAADICKLVKGDLDIYGITDDSSTQVDSVIDVPINSATEPSLSLRHRYLPSVQNVHPQPATSRESKQNLITTSMQCLHDLSMLSHRDDIEFENLSKKLHTVEKEKEELQEDLKFNQAELDRMDKQKRMIELQHRSVVDGVEQKLKNHNSKTEQLTEECRMLNLSIDQCERQKEALQDKLEEKECEFTALRERYDELTLKYVKVVEEHSRCPSKCVLQAMQSYTARLDCCITFWIIFAIVFIYMFILGLYAWLWRYFFI